MANLMALGGVVLCGGLSRRMGMAKAWLPCGSEPMLARVVRRLSVVAAPIVVVAAAGQDVPPLSESVRVVRDQREEQGPLEGLRAGLTALLEAGVAPPSAAYVTSCDVPLLVPDFATRLHSLLEDYDAVVPTEFPRTFVGDEAGVVEGAWRQPSERSPRVFPHPLAAIYRLAVLPQVERQLQTRRLRLSWLLDDVRTRHVPVDDLRDVDPRLDSLFNVNSPADYEQALRRL